MQCRLREHLKSYPEGMLPDANLASTPAKRSYITSRSDASNSSFVKPMPHPCYSHYRLCLVTLDHRALLNRPRD